MSSNLYSGPTSGLGLTLLSVGTPAMLCMTGFAHADGSSNIAALSFKQLAGSFSNLSRSPLLRTSPACRLDPIFLSTRTPLGIRGDDSFFRERSEKYWTSKVGKSSPRLQQGSITTPNNALSTANSSWLPYDSWFDSPIFSQHGSLNHHCSKDKEWPTGEIHTLPIGTKRTCSACYVRFLQLSCREYSVHTCYIPWNLGCFNRDPEFLACFSSFYNEVRYIFFDWGEVIQRTRPKSQLFLEILLYPSA